MGSSFLHVKSDPRKCPAEPGISVLSCSRFFHRQHQTPAHDAHAHGRLDIEPGRGQPVAAHLQQRGDSRGDSDIHYSGKQAKPPGFFGRGESASAGNVELGCEGVDQ